MRRREFAAQAGLVVAAGGLGWPRRRAADRLKKIGIQLYSVRDLFRADPERTLAALAAIGYAEVEYAGYGKVAPAEVAAMLRRTGLAAPSAHLDLKDLTDRWPATLEAAHTIGHQYLILAWIAPEERVSLDRYRRIGETLIRAAEAAAKAGIKVGYHNHDFEFAPMEGKRGYDVLLESTARTGVEFELDLYWATKAGANPLALFAAWPGRFPLVHVKDMGAGQAMVDVGDGTIDFAAIFARRGQAGIIHAFVEHDEPRDAMAFARKSHAAMAKLRF